MSVYVIVHVYSHGVVYAGTFTRTESFAPYFPSILYPKLAFLLINGTGVIAVVYAILAASRITLLFGSPLIRSIVDACISIAQLLIVFHVVTRSDTCSVV